MTFVESSYSIQCPRVEISFAMSRRTYFSGIYLAESMSSAQAAGHLESEMDPQGIGEHKQRVVVSIIMAAAAIEAAVNELCCDVVDDAEFLGVPLEAAEMFALCWEDPLGLERRSALEKCEVFVKICALRPPKDAIRDLKGSSKWGHALHLFRLRNLLMHYRPVTVGLTDVGGSGSSGGDPQIRKLAAALDGRFSRNAFSSAGDPFYPDRILGYGCADWASSTAAKFIKGLGDVSGFTNSVSYRHACNILAPSEK